MKQIPLPPLPAQHHKTKGHAALVRTMHGLGHLPIRHHTVCPPQRLPVALRDQADRLAHRRILIHPNSPAHPSILHILNHLIAVVLSIQQHLFNPRAPGHRSEGLLQHAKLSPIVIALLKLISNHQPILLQGSNYRPIALYPNIGHLRFTLLSLNDGRVNDQRVASMSIGAQHPLADRRIDPLHPSDPTPLPHAPEPIPNGRRGGNLTKLYGVFEGLLAYFPHIINRLSTPIQHQRKGLDVAHSTKPSA